MRPSMISRNAVSSGLRRSSDSTSGLLPNLSCFTRRDTTLIRMFGSVITLLASFKYSSLKADLLLDFSVSDLV